MKQTSKPAISMSLTDDEKAALDALAQQAFPDAERGAQSALIRKWLYEAAKQAEIEIKNKTQYGGDRKKRNAPGD